MSGWWEIFVSLFPFKHHPSSLPYFFPENYSQTQQCLHALLYNVCLLYNVLALYSANSKFEGSFPFLLCDQILQNLQNCLTIIWNFWISLCIRKFVLRNFSLMPVASISTYGIITTKISTDSILIVAKSLYHHSINN